MKCFEMPNTSYTNRYQQAQNEKIVLKEKPTAQNAHLVFANAQESTPEKPKEHFSCQSWTKNSHKKCKFELK